jgi:hypothetical protein
MPNALPSWPFNWATAAVSGNAVSFVEVMMISKRGVKLSQVAREIAAID